MPSSSGPEDAALGLVEHSHWLAPLIAALNARDRKILHGRFCEKLPQAQLGDRLGCSQMHVSRLIKRIIGRLRQGMLGELGCA